MIGLGLPRGFLVTLKHFLRPAVTEQYPDRHVGLIGAAKAAGMNPFKFLINKPTDSLKAIVGLATVPVAVRPDADVQERERQGQRQVLPEPGAGGRRRQAVLQAAGDHPLQTRTVSPSRESSESEYEST